MTGITVNVFYNEATIGSWLQKSWTECKMKIIHNPFVLWPLDFSDSVLRRRCLLSVSSRNTQTDTVSRLCVSGDESTVLNRITPSRPTPPSIFGTLCRRTQRLWILIVYQTDSTQADCSRNGSADSVISGRLQQSHQHHIPSTKLTPAVFPEMRVCFGLCGLLSLSFFFFSVKNMVLFHRSRPTQSCVIRTSDW